MRSFTLKVQEVAREDRSKSRPLQPIRVQSATCDLAAGAAREWARGECREVVSLHHGPEDTIHLVVYPQKQ